MGNKRAGAEEMEKIQVFFSSFVLLPRKINEGKKVYRNYIAGVVLLQKSLVVLY
jgi:hypothetical protein